VCSAAIRVVRADEIARIAAEHIRRGGAAWMVTFTARHHLHHGLADLYDAMAKGWHRLTTGRAWKGDVRRGMAGIKDQLGMTGYVRSLEVTYGFTNGFHPHLHVLVLTDGETPEGQALAQEFWKTTWTRFLMQRGYEAPSEQFGITWRRVHTPVEAGEYIAKVQDGGGIGNEMARGDLKKGRHKTFTMFELMDYYRQTGDARVIPVWREHEQVTFRRNAITTSHGLRGDYLGDEPELTDEEIVAVDKGGETWALLSPEAAQVVGRNPKLKAHLLDVAEDGGFPALVEAFTALHLAAEFIPPQSAA
jgi:hypothetical protein